MLVLAFGGQAAGAATSTVTFTADVWADNWFALYVNGVKVAQDPVPITTTKSFNKVTSTFRAKYPLTIGIIAKDYVENASGLEYIGSPQQQIGDAGIIAQIHEKTSGKLVAATSKSWKTYVLFKAPLNPECVTSGQPLVDCKSTVIKTPSSWTSSKYSTSKWESASTYTESQVGVKDGYNEVNWDTRAKLIWSRSLTLDNTVLFRSTAKTAMPDTKALTLSSQELLAGSRLAASHTCDGVGLMPRLTWTGLPAGTKSLALTMDTIPGPPRPGETVQTDFNHLVHYNIDPQAASLDSALTIGVKGKNFKGTLGYTPPCSQGTGEKSYTFHLYAVGKTLTGTGLTGAQALEQISGSLLGETKLIVFYARG